MTRTEVLPASPEAIERAAALIRNGDLVAFPTETVYGLGADALNARAVRRIFEAKGRPGDNPLIVHVSGLGQAQRLIRGALPEQAFRLAEMFWPGPLTMVFEKSALVPGAVSAGLNTVGVRMPAHPAARALIERSGAPIAAPSANLSGAPSPTSAAHVLHDLDGRVPLILDGGDCAVGLESTVLDVTRTPPVVLRPGGVTPEMIARAVGEVALDPHVMAPLADGDVPASPGMKHRHYAPEAELIVVTGGGRCVVSTILELSDAAAAQGRRAAILAREAHLSLYGDRTVVSLGADEGQAARALFAALRALDAEGMDLILAEGYGADGLGLALMNRLARAAAFHLIDTGED